MEIWEAAIESAIANLYENNKQNRKRKLLAV
jgi:hypothetical protein